MKIQLKHLLPATLLGVACTMDLLAQPTEATYQGHLTDAGSSFTGTAEFRVTLWDAPTGGSPVATNNPAQIILPVTNGLFTVEMEFGTNAFNGAERYLQIEVRTTVAPFTTLAPRQQITSAPYAITAKNLGAPLSAAALSGVYDQAVSLNNAANSFTGNGSGLTGINSLDAADGTPTDAVFVDNNGRVGIGTNTPSDALHVMGAIRTAQEVVVQNPNNPEASARYSWLNDVARLRIGGIGAGAGGGFDIQRTGDQSIFRILHSGNVGIGTANPTANLHIDGSSSGDAGFFVQSPGGSTGDVSIGSPGGFPGISGRGNNLHRRDIRFTDDGLALWTSSTSSSPGVGNGMVIDEAGEVGIGTISPSYSLHVESTGSRAVFGTTSGSYGVYGSGSLAGVFGGNNSSTGSGVFGRNFNVTGVNYGVQGQSDSTTGRGVYGHTTALLGVGIAVYGVCDSPQGYDFYADGAGVNYGGNSSIRWKRNIEPIADPLGMLAQIRAVYFDWDEAHGGQHDIGFIGEEVGKVLPEIVGFEPDGEYVTGMDYGKMTPLLTAAVNALRAEKDVEIAELKARIEKLEQLLDRRLNGGAR